LKGDYPRIISAKFGWDWLSSFRGEHNDEVFNIYYVIFHELWTFAYFDRLCKLEKRGDEINKNLLLWNYWVNLNQTLLRWSVGTVATFNRKIVDIISFSLVEIGSVVSEEKIFF
jgi:hypothetical protein